MLRHANNTSLIVSERDSFNEKILDLRSQLRKKDAEIFIMKQFSQAADQLKITLTRVLADLEV